MRLSRPHAWLHNSWAPEQSDAVSAAFRRLGSDADFLLVVEDLARYAGLRTTSFLAGQADQVAFSEGQRDLVFHLLEMAGMTLAIQPNAPEQSVRTQPKKE